MAKFKKKPIIIEAIQFDGINFKEIFDWVEQWQPKDDGQGMWQVEDGTGHLIDALIIDTMEGEMRADSGDWIIKGIKDELYPCKPDIFEQIYELVE